MDLIDRETAYKVLTEYYHHRMEIQHKGLREALAKVPTALVRCKDCKYFKTYPLGETDCAYIGEKAWAQGELNFDPDDFCSRGEREDEDGLED